MDEFDESPSVARPKPSKIPSWIMLGFVLGALFVWALPRAREPAPSLREPAVVRPTPAPVPTHPRLTVVEAVFDDWKQYALWEGNTTYVCLWDSESGTFRDCFEVLRRGDDSFFFRNVARPANLLPRDGVPAQSPLQFLNPVPEVRGLFGQRIAPPPAEKLPRPPD